MSEIDLDMLEAIARGASRCRWRYDQSGPEADWVMFECSHKDAHHIATFDPPTILAMIAELRAYRAAKAHLREVVRDMHPSIIAMVEEILQLDPGTLAEKLTLR